MVHTLDKNMHFMGDLKNNTLSMHATETPQNSLCSFTAIF